MLEEMNPWWKTENWEKVDYDLLKFKSMKYKWIPDWIKRISLAPFSLNFVLGPRQVGKTTGIKLLIRRLIERGENPRDIVYINCDLLASFKELRKVLGKQGEKKFIVLDEVTSIEYWWKVVKGFIDLGLFKNSVLVVSGSSSVKVRKFVESFSGRRGKGRDILVLPLDFKCFFKVLNYKKSELKEAFYKYLELGGFPRSINEDKTFLRDFLGSIEKEFARIGRSYSIAREIIYQLMLKAPSPVSYKSIGSSIGVSHVTVREYIGLLEDLFLVKVAYYKKGRRVDFKKEKKVFIRDPFVARAYSKVFGLEIRKGVLEEWVVQEHLFRKFNEIYYWRNKLEIDCIAGNLRVEVKIGKPRRRYPRNVILLDENRIARFLLKL